MKIEKPLTLREKIETFRDFLADRGSAMTFSWQSLRGTVGAFGAGFFNVQLFFKPNSCFVFNFNGKGDVIFRNIVCCEGEWVKEYEPEDMLPADLWGKEREIIDHLLGLCGEISEMDGWAKEI